MRMRSHSSHDGQRSNGCGTGARCAGGRPPGIRGRRTRVLHGSATRARTPDSPHHTRCRVEPRSVAALPAAPGSPRDRDWSSRRCRGCPGATGPEDLGLPAHRPMSLLLWSSDEPDHAEPVEPRWFAVKMRALLCHSSQSATTMGERRVWSADTRGVRGGSLAWQDASGAAFGIGPAETFKRITP